jgi:hypothetical protein
MSKTDFFDNPLTPPAKFELSVWQKRQATLLYHFAHVDRLKELKKLLDDFIQGVDITLDFAQAQGRDELITNPQWGVRDTAANFGTYGFSALKDFQKSLVKQMAQIKNDYYHATGYIQCSRLMSELSMGWTTPDEEEQFEAGMRVIGDAAGGIDSAMEHTWDEYSIYLLWIKLTSQFSQIPKFRVRTDISGDSGKLPPRTGVYVPQDDPYGSLQFSWTGNNDGCLFECQTFNALGLQALNIVGRANLWENDSRLLPIVKQPQYINEFKKLNWLNEPDFLNDSKQAKRFIALEGFTTRPCKWYFVELIEGEGEFEDVAELEAAEVKADAQRIRVPAGQPCPQTGYYFTPAQVGSRRYFKQGDTMPSLGGDYGVTIWQWDTAQG